MEAFPPDLQEELEVVSEVPAVTLMVNLDVNALLDERTDVEVFEFIGKLKDLVNG